MQALAPDWFGMELTASSLYFAFYSYESPGNHCPWLGSWEGEGWCPPPPPSPSGREALSSALRVLPGASLACWQCLGDRQVQARLLGFLQCLGLSRGTFSGLGEALCSLAQGKLFISCSSAPSSLSLFSKRTAH